jgi:predicted nucleotidyltransferase component of viral defense system
MNTLHKDPGMFRDALALTRERTGFAERLIEKDYFCTALLEYLTAASEELVFKGGTCLAKVHANFYRLSEDLDFVISTPSGAPRSQRSRHTAIVKTAVAVLPRRLPEFQVVKPLVGVNNSTHYIAVMGYTSPANGREETVKIEVGLREPLLLAPFDGQAQTILLDPISRSALMKPVKVRCIAKVEAFAEKFRAALSRREVAIRDYYDIDFAVRRLGLRPDDAELIRLVRQKLVVPGNRPVDSTEKRLAALRQQVEPQ